jgi:hypothetical protein
MVDEDVAKWMTRLKRNKPFYLVLTRITKTGDCYKVIWNETAKGVTKTKMGWFSDGMSCRYGAQGIVVLNGETPFDLWNGKECSPKEFEHMLAVRKKKSKLREFDLDEIERLEW